MAEAVMAAAASLCVEDAVAEEEKYGLLMPCRKISPLSPPLKLEEYSMLERDRGKYMLYWAAIHMAFQAMVESSHHSQDRRGFVQCIVVGPGLGRLIRFCLDAARKTQTTVIIHAVEANPLAVEFLKKEYEANCDSVTIHGPLVLHPFFRESDLPDSLSCLCHRFDFAVSELLGSFGDDEFLPEITAAIQHLFLKPSDSIMIPRTWTTYVAPIHSPRTREFFVKAKKPLDACYVMGLPQDCIILAQEGEMWSGNCSQPPQAEFSGYHQFNINHSSLICPPCNKLKQNHGKEITELFVHGFIGYFTSELWPGIMIDTRHTSSFRNCFHWEAYYFPLKEPLCLSIPTHETKSVNFYLKRKCVSSKVHKNYIVFSFIVSCLCCFCPWNFQ
jgi:protein arginine N-methyltransferase 5